MRNCFHPELAQVRTSQLSLENSDTNLELSPIVPLSEISFGSNLDPETAPTRRHWKHALWWLTYPFAYLVDTMIRGHILATYSCPFLDVTTLGYGRVLANACGLLLVFLGIGLVIFAVSMAFSRDGSLATREAD
jgi:hypothetical protein